MTTDSNASSDNIFGIQLDPGGSGQNIEGYWDGTIADSGRPSIANLTGITANGWYRFRVEITKLTATSASLVATLTELNSGIPGTVVATGSIPDTDLLAADVPNSKYFTGPIWPAFKNYSGTGGAADNAVAEIILATPTPTPTAPPTATPTPIPTPEPGATLQLVAGGVGLAFLNQRRMRKNRRAKPTS